MTLAIAEKAAPPGLPETVKTELNELEKKLQETLTGAVLDGQFTLIKAGKVGGLKKERYTIVKVTKFREDYWNFMARVEYGGKDVTIPMTLQVKWAGDTPVITLTNLQIPKLGTYTARVLIHGEEYAGTWSGGTHNGHLFGRVIKE